MAQSANNLIMEQDSLYNSLRIHLTSLGLCTAEKFFMLDKSEIKKQICLLLGKILMSHDNAQISGEAQSTMLSLYGFGCFERFTPLIGVILANEAKSNQEMHQFINEEFNSSPTLVRTVATSSLMNSSSYLCHFLPALNLELKDLMYTNVPGLVEHIIQQHPIDPAWLQQNESFINQNYEKVLTDTSEPSMLDWITLLVKYFSDWLHNKISTQHSRTWQSLPNKHMKGVDGKRKMDGAIVSQYFKQHKNDIRNVLVPVELKKNESDTREAALCLAKYVGDVFKAQPTRSYVIGFTLCGTLMQLWQFDRSGAIGSESFDIKKTKEGLNKFLTLILLFLTSKKEVLGFDPTFIDIDGQACTNTPKPQKIQISTKPNPQELVIDRLIFRASRICGRGTTCWQAHLSGDESKKILIKDSWQPLHQTEEGVMLCDVTEKNVPHVVRYHHHETVHVASQIVDIETHIRGSINFRSGQKIQITDASADPQEPTDLTNSADPHNKPTDLADPQEPTDLTNRAHRRLILKDVGQPIWTVDSPVRLLEALEGCITGHQALLNAGYLHRDISINNLMVDNQTDDPDRKSFLIDLDLAVAYPIVNEEDRTARTGTKVFMSFNLLTQENPHNFVDDLESFFWVLIWTCIHYPAHQRKKSLVTNWNQDDPKTLGVLKIGYLYDPHYLTDDFTPLYTEFKPLIHCVHEFAKVMLDSHVRGKQPETLYGEILDILRKAQGKPIEGQ